MEWSNPRKFHISLETHHTIFQFYLTVRVDPQTPMLSKTRRPKLHFHFRLDPVLPLFARDILQVEAVLIFEILSIYDTWIPSVSSYLTHSYLHVF